MNWFLRPAVAISLLVLVVVSSCQTTHTIRPGDAPDALDEFLRHDGRKVLTFVGYSGAGYEDEDDMLRLAGEILDQHDSARTIVNIGVTPDGIGQVYPLAKQRGFTTMGIVSTKAREYDPSPDVDHIFYIEDDQWGGLVETTGTLSPTSARLVRHSDFVIGIGGGEIARDELQAAIAAGKEVTFFPADLNHRTAREKARKSGQPEPTTFSGEAATAF